MEVIQKYNVAFYIDQSGRKRISTINGMLTGYISDWYYLEKANELYDEICKVMNNSIDAILETQSLYLAVMNALNTKIYIDMYSWEKDKNIIPDYVLPTSDFKEIAEEWKKYMEM